ncbi:GNAT family N-acetyltransferase [Kineosporia succinea]|uniref:Ribosomal protein S18 acetylase RimI-like enzyme n=1 Tax=Kineosporia succinea TaxID=84632 RepID=A0ABT9PA12_9ACTN|nr:GNAT family N-acetyltransferase [Kineosporia succinea]MDP9829322.1 ribosomal protein S18 acetylase RimI-like enzyme [Kineosporia succinea]
METIAPTLRPARLPEDLEQLTRLNIEYLTWATGRLWDEFEVVLPVPDAAESASTVAKFAAPGGVLLVLEQGDELVGTGALRTLEPGVVEVKRMYVRASLQGRRLGSALLDRLLLEAQDQLGAHTVRLDSCNFMVEAQRLYRRRGFVERDAYQGSEIPGPLQQHWRFFEWSRV